MQLERHYTSHCGLTRRYLKRYLVRFMRRTWRRDPDNAPTRRCFKGWL
jgi:hypothetical protein